MLIKMDFDKPNKNHDFLLLNKDTVLAEFHVNDLFVNNIIIDKVYWDMPGWIDNLSLFISNRRAPKQRENIRELLELSGCDTVLGYLQISHALSLIDTFWVKPKDSTLSWNDVSLYTHEFNEVIAKTAFEGGLHGMELSTTSPEYGTDGSFAKCWIREGNQIKMLKRGSSGYSNAGLEPYSEYYAAQIIKELTDDYVDYDLRSVRGRVCSVCDLFTSEEYGFIPYAAIDKGNANVASVVAKMRSYGLDDKTKLMFIVDAIIMNEDRHKNNFGFLVNNKTQKIEGMAPLFDHNISLLPYAIKEDFSNIEEYIKHKGPRLSDTWIESAALCMTPSIRRKLINLTDITLTSHPKYNLPNWRIDTLTKIVQSNIQDILYVSDRLKF